MNDLTRKVDVQLIKRRVAPDEALQIFSKFKMLATRRIHLLAVMPFIGMAVGQTPPGFSPEVDTSLNVSFTGMDLSKSGELMAMKGK